VEIDTEPEFDVPINILSRSGTIETVDFDKDKIYRINFVICDDNNFCVDDISQCGGYYSDEIKYIKNKIQYLNLRSY
jgi:hypothetical protein